MNRSAGHRQISPSIFVPFIFVIMIYCYVRILLLDRKIRVFTICKLLLSAYFSFIPFSFSRIVFHYLFLILFWLQLILVCEFGTMDNNDAFYTILYHPSFQFQLQNNDKKLHKIIYFKTMTKRQMCCVWVH